MNGERRSVAVAELNLDKKIEPLARDTEFRVRPRSALGLKYIELQPGTSKSTWQSGDTVPVKQSSEPLEFEDLFSTFDRETRPNIQRATDGFGNAFAGRGRAINNSIEALNPFFKALTPVMRNLSNPRTELDQFFLQMGRASEQVAPVARTQALLFTDMADTFAAISASPRALQDTIEKGAPTMDVSIDSFRVQQPFMTDFTDLSARLRPAAAELPRSLPAINSAFKVGTPVLPRTVELNENLEKAFNEADDLFENPNTLLALKDLTTAVTVTRPALEYITPYQTVCNYLNYFIHPLGEVQSVVQTGPTGGGTVLNQNVKEVNSDQQNNYGTSASSRPWDIPAGQKPQGAKDFQGKPLFRLYATAYNPAIDAQGNADCQLGQTGYPNGALGTGPLQARRHQGRVRGARPPDSGRVRLWHQRRHHREQPAGSLGWHLPNARARDRQPEGRAMSGRSNGMSPFRAGILALVIVGLFAYFGFTKANPFANPYEFKAAFNDVNNLKPKSPVRIAGVEVGKVKKVEPITRASRAPPW